MYFKLKVLKEKKGRKGRKEERKTKLPPIKASMIAYRKTIYLALSCINLTVLLFLLVRLGMVLLYSSGRIRFISLK